MTTKKTAFAKSIVTQLENDAIFAITADGRKKHTDHWELPSHDDGLDLLDL